MALPLQFPHAEPPPAGTVREVAPGVHWLRMALPFALDHINLWLLEDGDGLVMIDCGLADDATRAAWDRVLADFIGQRTVRRLIVTHYHPDHAGLASWLIARHGCELWMTQGEYLSAHVVYNDAAGYSPAASNAFFKANGLGPEHDEGLAKRGNFYRKSVVPLPLGYRRMLDGDVLNVGGRDWQVMVGYGHAPEHVSLYCASLGVCISGDMLPPKISTNVSVWTVEPQGDPLRLFLSSIRRYRELPHDTLILPSHGLPFRGAHTRVEALEQHHAERLADLERAIAASPAPMHAAELLETLFRRKLDTHQTTFAMGEAVAHLHYLCYAGRLRREVGADGVLRYAAAKASA
ncbi:MAG: MBL fold metallo-hydrolase [Betaproteobacteria bacterium]|nr:MBL fold metallo-hydrolase [Betaproteobacteria bacterium]